VGGAAAGGGAAVAVPIVIGDAVWGALTVGFAAPGAATAERVEFLGAIAAHLAVAIKNAELYTRLRAAHRDLQAAQAQAIERERLRALGEMASGIAHDFNNTLALIVGVGELLALPGGLDDPAAVREHLALVRTAAKDAAGTVSRLREVFRARDPGEPAAPVDLNAVAALAVALTQFKWKDQAQTRGAAVRVATDLRAVPAVAGDEAALREALTNLILNAVDALPAGGTVTLRTRTEGAHAVLEVADSGTGMTAEVRRRCLEPFFTTKGERGTGLGLGMVHGTVRRHEGTLEIDSAPGAGTTVRLRLPRRRAAAAAAARRHTAAPAAAAAHGIRAAAPVRRQRGGPTLVGLELIEVLRAGDERDPGRERKNKDLSHVRAPSKPGKIRQE
jgi:signal transduction histidine kinase